MRYERRNPEGGGAAGCLPHVGGCGPDQKVRHVCDITEVTTKVLNTAAGANGTLTMQINRCNFFQPCSARVAFIGNADATQNLRADIYSLEINQCAQSCGSNSGAAFDALNLVGLTDNFTAIDWPFGLPVCWGTWARNTFAEIFQMLFGNISAAAGDMYMTQWGQACPALPPGCTLGKPSVEGYN